LCGKVVSGWVVVVPYCVNNTDMMGSWNYVVGKILSGWVVSLM